MVSRTNFYVAINLWLDVFNENLNIGKTNVVLFDHIKKQAAGMGLPEMLEDLPNACDVGTKKNSKGYKTSWIGYKLHIDSADGGIPISCVLTSAPIHDSQVTIPLAKISNERVNRRLKDAFAGRVVRVKGPQK